MLRKLRRAERAHCRDRIGIAAAVDEQSFATREIARNVQQAAEGTSQVATTRVEVTL